METLVPGRHYFNIPNPGDWRTASFGIWPAVSRAKGAPKKGKAVVVIKAPCDRLEDARLVAEYIRDQLDAGTYAGHKHVDLETGTGRRLLLAAQYKAGVVVLPKTRQA